MTFIFSIGESRCPPEAAFPWMTHQGNVEGNMAVLLGSQMRR